MNPRPCSGCGRFSCSGECYLECEADYAEEEATISTLTLDDLREMYGDEDRVRLVVERDLRATIEMQRKVA